MIVDHATWIEWQRKACLCIGLVTRKEHKRILFYPSLWQPMLMMTPSQIMIQNHVQPVEECYLLILISPNWGNATDLWLNKIQIYAYGLHLPCKRPRLSECDHTTQRFHSREEKRETSISNMSTSNLCLIGTGNVTNSLVRPCLIPRAVTMLNSPDTDRKESWCSSWWWCCETMVYSPDTAQKER